MSAISSHVSASAKAPAACTVIRNPCRSGDTLIEQHLPEISDGATVAGRPKNIFESDASGPAPLDPSDFSKDQTTDLSEDGEAIKVDGLLQLSAEADGPPLDGPHGPAPQKLKRKPRYDAEEFAKLAKIPAVIEGPDLGRSKGVMYLLAAQDCSLNFRLEWTEELGRVPNSWGSLLDVIRKSAG